MAAAKVDTRAMAGSVAAQEGSDQVFFPRLARFVDSTDAESEIVGPKKISSFSPRILIRAFLKSNTPSLESCNLASCFIKPEICPLHLPYHPFLRPGLPHLYLVLFSTVR